MKAVPRWLAVSLGLAAFIAVSLGIAYVAGFRGPLSERCTEYCASQGKQGKLVPMFPRTMTGTKGSQENCECQ
jgi:hypothetical protein